MRGILGVGSSPAFRASASVPRMTTGFVGLPWIAEHPIAYPALEVVHIIGIVVPQVYIWLIAISLNQWQVVCDGSLLWCWHPICSTCYLSKR